MGLVCACPWSQIYYHKRKKKKLKDDSSYVFKRMFYLFIIVVVFFSLAPPPHVHVYGHAMAHMWSLEDNFWVSVVSFYHVGPGN